jgi:hypothetical protein
MGDGTAGKPGLPAIDVSVAHHARIYDYLLGGKDNYAADREFAEAALKIWPEMAITARANRAFLGAGTEDGLTDVSKRMVGDQHTFRTLDQVARFFAGLDLVRPGVVRAEEWRPDPGGAAGKSALWCAVGRKR